MSVLSSAHLFCHNASFLNSAFEAMCGFSEKLTTVQRSSPHCSRAWEKEFLHLFWNRRNFQLLARVVYVCSGKIFYLANFHFIVRILSYFSLLLRFIKANFPDSLVSLLEKLSETPHDLRGQERGRKRLNFSKNYPIGRMIVKIYCRYKEFATWTVLLNNNREYRTRKNNIEKLPLAHEWLDNWIGQHCRITTHSCNQKGKCALSTL